MDHRGEPDQQEFANSREQYQVQAVQRMRQRVSADEDDEPGDEAFRPVMEDGQRTHAERQGVDHARRLLPCSGSAGRFSGLEFSVIAGIGRPSRRPRSSGADPASPRRPTNACAACRANHARRWSSISRKNILLLFSCKSVHPCAVPPGKRGGSRSSRNARWDAVDAEAMTDEAGMTRTAKSCGSGAAVLALSFTGQLVERRWQESRSPGRARSKP
jgi:hypothetical protein